MQKTSLKKIAKIYNGNSINAKTKAEKYSLKCNGWSYIGTKDVNFDGSVSYDNGVVIPFSDTSFKIAPAQSVFVCSEGGSAGKKTAYVDRDVCFGNKLYAIVNDRGLFYPKYIYYYTRYREFFEQFKKLMNGIIGGVSSKKFGEIEIPLSSLPEQNLIVQKIEELFADLDKGVEELKQAKARLKVYRQAVLKEAFAQVKQEDELGNLAKMIDPQPSHRTPPEIDGGIPYIGIGDIDYTSQQINFSKARKVSHDVLVEHLNRYTLEDGDFLMGKIGTIGKPFKVALPQNYTLSANVILIKPNNELIEPKYLFWQFSSVLIEKQLVKNSSATSQPAFGITKARKLQVKICSREKQKAIVQEIEAKLSTCDKQEQIINESLQKAESLRQSILKQAFEGRLV